MYKWVVVAFLCVTTMVGSNGMALAAGTDNQNLEDKVIDATGLSKKMDIQEVEAEIADAAAEKTPVDPSIAIQELVEDYNTNGKGSLFLGKMGQDELYYTTATAVVFVDTNNKKWINYRTMAYQDAVAQAQAQYMKFLGTSIRTSTLRELATDTEMPEFSQEELQSGNALVSIYKKLVALGGAVLDEQLDKHGVDPEEFKAAPPSKQKDLFRNAIETQTITTARGELTGMIPVKTFEANDDKGNYVVGVAVVASPKFRSRMKSIVTNKWDLPPNSKKVGGPGVRKQIVKDKMSLIQEFGIRQIYDEEGYPVLVSYGQSGNLYTGDNAQMKLQYRNAAFDSARSDAYANFATLLKSSGQLENKDSKKAISRQIAKVTAEKGSLFESEETIQDYIQKMNSMVQIKGKINNMPGIHELYKWTTTHPANGQEVNGVILAWSPKTANSAKKLVKAPKAKKAKPKTAAPASAAAGARSGSDLMDASDF